MELMAGNKMKDENTSGSEGFVLLTVSLLLFLFTAMGLASLVSIQSSVKSSGLLRLDTIRYYQADGGVLSVIGYMTAFKRTDIPSAVKHTAAFDVVVTVFGQSVRYPPGFSTLWKGADVKTVSTSKAVSASNAGAAVIEAIAFIPTSPAGYGNE